MKRAVFFGVILGTLMVGGLAVAILGRRPKKVIIDMGNVEPERVISAMRAEMEQQRKNQHAN